MSRAAMGTTPGGAVHVTIHMNGAPGGWRQSPRWPGCSGDAWLGVQPWHSKATLLQQLCRRGRLFLEKVMPEGLLVACWWPAQG